MRKRSGPLRRPPHVPVCSNISAASTLRLNGLPCSRAGLRGSRTQKPGQLMCRCAQVPRKRWWAHHAAVHAREPALRLDHTAAALLAATELCRARYNGHTVRVPLALLFPESPGRRVAVLCRQKRI